MFAKVVNEKIQDDNMMHRTICKILNNEFLCLSSRKMKIIYTLQIKYYLRKLKFKNNDGIYRHNV